MKIYPLEKTVFEITGQAEKFLNGVTSNSFDRVKNAFLDVHGRIIATFDQMKTDKDNYLIVIESKFYDTLMQHLDKFIKLSGVLVSKTNFRVFFDLEGDYQKNTGEYAIPQRRGQLIITKKDLSRSVTDEEFTLFRLKSHIPVQGIDYTNEMVLNVDQDEFVSYTKGCFLGQEFVSKVHSRSKPTWKLVVKAEDACTPEEKPKMTSKVPDPETGKILGFVFTANR